MLRFIIFAGLLVTAAYLLTAPPKPELALSSNEAPAVRDKPLLTSWGRTLGSLRASPKAPTPSAPNRTTQTAAAAQFNQYGKGTELWILGQTNGWKGPAYPEAEDRGWAADNYVETAANLPTVQASEDPPINAKRLERRGVKPSPSRLAEDISAERAEPVIDRIAVARPPERRGLFSRNKTAKRSGDVTRVSNGRPKRGLFARLKGRSQPVQRPFTVGPAR